ncbi:carboxylesterase family protein [Neobacillus sp. CF12]|nr:carboxylesterase family protein [Neobacillus sp. CF12]MDM5327071.1 carboxylesterase family protein [Neobacillus sp. CF12]
MSNTIVGSAYGKLQGEKIDAGVFAWKGIPYAKPPVGSLRFRAPELPDSWEGIRKETSFSPVAPQSQREIMEFFGNDISNMNEDCLYLNVWSPGADDKKRPVMVWIHGGAFVSGSGSSTWYDGASFAAQGDVVVVTINYRLGILAFFISEKLAVQNTRLLGIAVFWIRLLLCNGYKITSQHLAGIRIM